jgi:hypothetical protein
MPGTVSYYASIGHDRTIDNPYGLLRRTHHPDGPEDEALGADLTWRSTPLIIEWEAGNGVYELAEVSEEQAGKIIGYFRDRWGADPGSAPN